MSHELGTFPRLTQSTAEDSNDVRSQIWEEQLAGGPLNHSAPEQLRDSFDTYRLLDAVDAVDAIRYRLCEPDEVRDDLLHLHDMASALINGGGLNGRRANQPIWSLAAT